MVAKFVPGFAAVATSMAGVVRTPLLRFVLFDTIGALLWSGVAVALGWLFRDAVNDCSLPSRRRAAGDCDPAGSRWRCTSPSRPCSATG